MKAVYSLSNPDPENAILALDAGCLWNILRIVSGYVGIINDYYEDFLLHKKCLVDGSDVVNAESALSKLSILAEDFGFDDVSELRAEVKKLRGKNEGFYKAVLVELIAFVDKREDGDETGAFLHFYRMVEKFSYCFPMIYAARTDDFSKSFDTLKSFILDKEGGELPFFKTFLGGKRFNEYNSVTFSLDFNDFSDYLPNIESIFKDSSMAFTRELVDGKIDLNLIEFFQFVINARNRFFHNMSSRSNISTEQIVSADDFYFEVNENAISWFWIVLKVVLQTLFSRLSER